MLFRSALLFRNAVLLPLSRSSGKSAPEFSSIISQHRWLTLLADSSSGLPRQGHVYSLVYSQTSWSSNIKKQGSSNFQQPSNNFSHIIKKLNNDKGKSGIIDGEQKSPKIDTATSQKLNVNPLIESILENKEKTPSSFKLSPSVDTDFLPKIEKRGGVSGIPKLEELSVDKITGSSGSGDISKDNALKVQPTAVEKGNQAASENSKASAKKKKSHIDHTISAFERSFVTPVKAMNDYLLKPSDLEGLSKTRRRSPYESDEMIAVYWRKDVHAKALEIWGSKENLRKQKTKRELERKKFQQSMFSVKRRLRDYRKEMFPTAETVSQKAVIKDKSGDVIVTAIAINALNFLFKLVAWAYTGSSSMFSECIHSMADTVNQLILAYGIKKSSQIADSDHPYGYTNMRYVASLISGVGIFCVGAGLSFYHGITGLIHPHPMEDFFWAYYVLMGSLLSEGGTCLVALNSVRQSAEKLKMPLKDYIIRGQEPSVNVVLLEDFAAVLGVIAAGTCMAITTVTGNPRFDAIGSLLVGGILATVASFIIYTNVAALVGRSIPQASLEQINSQLESDIMIRAIHDVKGIDMGNFLVRYKAELDFDGRQLTKMYLDKLDLNLLLEEVQQLQNIDLLEEFMLRHGENIVDLMGAEIDRIEMNLRSTHPEIRHCDLEIL